MNTYFNRMFWGMILVFFDINLGSIDILPNIVGFIMIATAISGLSSDTKEEKSFKKGEVYAWIMVCLACIDIILKFSGYGNQDIGIAPSWIIIYGQLSSVINLIMVYYICKGIYNLGEKAANTEISISARDRWIYYFISTSSTSILMAFTLNFKEGILTTFIIIVVVINFIINILIMALVRKASRTFVDLDIEVV